MVQIGMSNPMETPAGHVKCVPPALHTAASWARGQLLLAAWGSSVPAAEDADLLPGLREERREMERT